MASQVLAERQAGTLSLDERLILARSDFVDGAGPINWHDPGTPISIRYLLEQMLTVSDNTATDMLIDRVGLDAVNARAAAWSPPATASRSTLAPSASWWKFAKGYMASYTPRLANWAG